MWEDFGGPDFDVFDCLRPVYRSDAGRDASVPRKAPDEVVGGEDAGEGSGSGMGERDDETGSVEICAHIWECSADKPVRCAKCGARYSPAPDFVAHPPHYTSDPSGVECITITRHRNFNVGNAIKYVWRAGLKKGSTEDSRKAEIEDLKKARWYLRDELIRLGVDPSKLGKDEP